MFEIKYGIELNEKGRPYIYLPENYEQRPEDRFFALEICRYMLQDVLTRRTPNLDGNTVQQMENSETLLGQLGDEVAALLFDSFKVNEKTKMSEFLRERNMLILANPHEFGWMGHVMYIDTREYADWTHSPVDTYDEAIEQAIEFALTIIKL